MSATFPTITPLVGDAGGAVASATVVDPDPGNIDVVVDSSDIDCAGFAIDNDGTDRDPPFTLEVRYVASTRGARTCTILAFDTGTTTSRGSFTVTGNGLGPHLELVADVVIGDVRVIGNTTGTGTLVLRNDGDAAGGDLMITSITPNGGCAFTVGPPPAFPIAVGFFANVTVTFNPTMAGNQSCSITVVSNGTPDGEQVPTASGRGTLAVINVNNPTYGGGTNIVEEGTSATTNISVSNTAILANRGVLGVTSASIVASGSVSWFTFAAGNGCTAGSETCTFSPALSIVSSPASVGIVCSPPANATGMQQATITFTSDTDAGGDATSDVTCIAGRADAAVAPPMAAFGDLLVNTTSSTTTINLTNLGNIPLDFDLEEIDPGGQFTVTLPCTTNCATLAGGGATTLAMTVAFAPTSVGAKSGTIRITSNDPDNPTLDIPLTGTGIAPHATVTVSSAMNFGTVEVGSTGTSRTLTITNDGSSPLTVSSAALISDPDNANWSVSGTLDPNPIPVNGSRVFTINCVPVTDGTLDTTFRVSSNSVPDNGTIDTVLTCTGNRATLTLNDTDHDFGGVIIGQMRDQAFTLTNEGNVAVTNVNVVIAGAGVGYTILNSPFPVASVAPDGVVNFTVRFMPAVAADGGDKTFTFSGMWGTAKTAMSVLTVHGDGLVEGYDATPPTLAFEQRFDQTSTRVFCITNTGDATVNITGISTALAVGTQTGEIRITNLVRRECGANGGTNIVFPLAQSVQLLKDEEVEAVVEFAPANRVGMMGATFTIMSDLQTGPPTRQVTVTATSTTAMLTNNPGILVDFGPTDLDTGPQMRNLVISNTGVATLDLANFDRTNNARFVATLPAGAQALAMGASVTIPITYTPDAERPAGQEDSFTISHDIDGVVGGPLSQTITIQGRGVDRHIDVGAAPTFPPTFRNPGSRAPTGVITISNTGDATLDISGVMITNDDVWHLSETGPVQIAGGGSHDFEVSFTPKMMGVAPQGEVVFTNNDNTSVSTMMARVTLDGMGLDRNVALLGEPIDVGVTAIGLPITLPDGIVVASMDAANAFTVREIQIVDDATAAFSIPDAPQDAALAAATMLAFDVRFIPTEEGEFTAKAHLFLDEDPEHAAEVTLRGRAVFVEVGGGGGCATTNPGSAGVVMFVIAAVLLARRRRKAAQLAAIATVVVLAFAPALVHAQAPAQTFDLDLSLFDPTPSTTGTTLQVQSAAVGKNGEWVASALLANATNPLIIRYADTEHTSITRRTMIEIGGAYAFLDRFEAGLRMPLYNQTGDGPDVGVPSPSGTARGDLVAHVRAQLVRTTGPTELVAGASLAVTFPTASEAQYAGVDMPSGRVLGLLTLTPNAMDKRLTLTVNAGGVVRSKSELQNIRQGSGIAFGGAASVRAIDGLWFFGEVYGEMLPSSEVPSVMASAGALISAEWLGGVTYRPDPRININLGAGRGLVSGLGTPDFRAVLAVSVTPGREMEVKPIEPPKPPVVEKDTDGDGILDGADACKDDGEDMDGFQDGDGCPDTDNDSDGFLDSDDKCKTDAEDMDEFQDDDGCPDLDNDGDGVVDTADKCPLVAEDKDGAQDDDGCPDTDNDGDGFADAVDKCPDQAETINGNADDDGCPDPGDSAIALTPSAVELLETIDFKGAELKPIASRVLGQVAATLKAHPEIVRIKIIVHVNPEGKDAKEKATTEERAMAIREWLIKAGISPDRVSGAGLGGTKPLIKGKKSPVNERVEIVILERK
ncbi:MAG: choice-of-anchor D domain-containing protein [Kofleriaceae bacterium]